MALTNTAVSVAATATNLQTVFDISDITFFATTDIKVYADGDEETTGFTVSVAGQTVTFDTGRTTGEKMVFERQLPKTQETTYTVQGKFPAASHETALDRTVAIIQEVAAITDRALSVAVTNTSTSWDGTIPDPGLAINRGKVLRIKADGTSIEAFAIDEAIPITISDMPINSSFTADLSTNDIVITLLGQNGAAPSATNPVWIPFRSTTATSGAFTWDKQTATETLTIPAGATLGHTAADIAAGNTTVRFYVYALRKAANDIELAVARQALWSGDTLQTTTAIGTGADSNAVLYSTTLRTSVPIQLIGVVEAAATTTAGTWTSIVNAANWQPGMRKTGDIVQYISIIDTTNGTTTALLPIDDTVPQSTEGAAIPFGDIATVTPTSVCNRMNFSALSIINCSVNDSWAATALFKNSETSAVAVAADINGILEFPVYLSLHYTEIPTSLTPVTWKLRYGTNAGTVRYNIHFQAGNTFGGLTRAHYIIQEIYA